MSEQEVTINTFYPGRPDYTGPTEGFFLALHHDALFEYSRNVKERVYYIKHSKAPGERESRLYQMCLFVHPPKEVAKAWEVHVKAWEVHIKARKVHIKAEKAYDKAKEAYGKVWEAYDKAKEAFAPEALKLLNKLVPDNTWNGREFIYEKSQ